MKGRNWWLMSWGRWANIKRGPMRCFCLKKTSIFTSRCSKARRICPILKILSYTIISRMWRFDKGQVLVNEENWFFIDWIWKKIDFRIDIIKSFINRNELKLFWLLKLSKLYFLIIFFLNFSLFLALNFNSMLLLSNWMNLAIRYVCQIKSI